MSDFEKLKIEHENDDVVVSVHEPTQPVVEQPEKKNTVFSVFIATIKGDRQTVSASAYGLPYLKYTLLSVITMFVIAVSVLVMNFFIGYKMLIPIVSFILTAIPPSIIMIYFYELNVDRKTGIFSLFISFLLGFFAYVILNFLSSFLYQFIAKEQIEQIGYPVILVLICFLDTFLLVNYNKTNRPADCFLLAVTFMMGFCFTTNLVQSFGKLFVIDGIVNTGTYSAPPGAGAIINTSEFLKGNYYNLFDNWLFEYFVLPHLYACWAVVIGFLVSYAVESKTKKSEAPKSIYLLLMLVVALNIIAVLDTAIDYLGIILKVVAFTGSTFLEITFINLYLQDLSKKPYKAA